MLIEVPNHRHVLTVLELLYVTISKENNVRSVFFFLKYPHQLCFVGIADLYLLDLIAQV